MNITVRKSAYSGGINICCRNDTVAFNLALLRGALSRKQPRQKVSGARRIAADILAELEKSESYSNLAIDAALKNTELAKADSAFVTRLVYGVTERKLTLDYYIDKLSKKPSSALSEKSAGGTQNGDLSNCLYG